MNIVVSLSDCPFVVPMPQLLCDPNLLTGIALRPHSDASGASAPTPALAGKSAARARPRTRKARTEREGTHHGHQEKCQGGTACALLAYILSVVSETRAISRRMHARLWRRTSSARADTYKSSTRCARNCKLSDCASRRYAATSKWQTPCGVPLVSVVSPSHRPHLSPTYTNVPFFLPYSAFHISFRT